MKLKLSLAIAILCSSFIFVGVLISCQKTDHSSAKNSKEKKEEVFNVANSKEWWYGTFRKSAAYNQIDWASTLAPPQGSSIKKYPSWKRAISYTQSNLEIVEMPLTYETNKVLLPGMQKLRGTPEGKRIAHASINRLLLIKDNTGKIEVRTVKIVPSAAYAKKNNYDISHITMKQLPSDFDGFLFIGNWQGKEKNIRKVEGGKFKKKISIITEETYKKRKALGNFQARQVCLPVWVPEMMWVCAVVPTGDDLADAEKCQEIGHWVEVGGSYQIECHEVPDGDEDPDPVSDCLQTSSPQDCLCILYDLCDEDEDGEIDEEECSQQGTDAKLAEVVATFDGTAEKVSTEIVENTGTRVTTKYKWRIGRIGNLGLITFFSHEIGIKETNVNGNWLFTSFVHDKISKDGHALFWTAEAKSITPTATIMNTPANYATAKMEIDCVIEAKYNCGGINSESNIPVNKEKTWAYYE
jgi:hypothetical protein